MSGVRYSARLLVRKRSLCIGGQGHVQVVFFSYRSGSGSSSQSQPTKARNKVESSQQSFGAHTQQPQPVQTDYSTAALLLECFSVLESLLVYLATCWKANTFRFFYLPKSISNSVKRFRLILCTEFSVRVEPAQPRNSPTSDRPKGSKVNISFCSFNVNSVWPLGHYKKIHFQLIGLIFKCNQSVFQQAVGVYCWTGCRQRKNMAPKPKTRRAAKPIRAACVSSYSIGFLPLLLSDSWHMYPLKYTNGQVSAPSNHGKSLG